MDNNDNSFYKQPDANQAYGQPEQTVYGQPEQQSAYGQPNQAYGQPNQTYGQQSAYGQSNQPYGQPNQAYGQYGQPNMYQPYGMNQTPVDAYGKPLKNRFGMKLTFSILEILSCNLITFIMGIIGCVFTTKANNSYKSGRVDDFKSQAKASAICLWVGFAGFIIGLILMIALWAVVGDVFMEAFREGYYGATPERATGPEIGVYVDDTYIEIPSDYSEIEDLGFHVESYYNDVTLDAGDIYFVSVENDDNEDVMWFWMENRHSYEAEIPECTVIGVDVDYDCDNFSAYRTEEGIDFSYSAEECIATLGTPDASEENNGRMTYYWYYDGGYNTSWRVKEITFDEDGYLYDIDITYR